MKTHTMDYSDLIIKFINELSPMDGSGVSRELIKENIFNYLKVSRDSVEGINIENNINEQIANAIELGYIILPYGIFGPLKINHSELAKIYNFK